MTDQTIPILLTLRFSDEQLDRLRSISPRLAIRQNSIHDDREDISSFLRGDEEVIYGMTPPRDLSTVPHLKWVQLHSAGVNRLREHPIWATGIQITTASGIHSVPIGEFVIAMMLALARKLPRIFRLQERTEWPRHKWQLLLGTELRDKTLGIVGYGCIGREVARLAKSGFNMHIGAMRYNEEAGRIRYSQPGVGDPEGKLPDRWYARDELLSMLHASDYVLLALPLTTESKNLIGEAELRAMKPEGFLINIARGELIDERALVHALKENWIAGAGLDTYAVEPLARESQLWHCENAILSPHVSAATPHYDDRAADLFGQNLRRYLSGLTLMNLVDREKGY
jgi:phosphoglycerate dehydrogenase-like enzyme